MSVDAVNAALLLKANVNDTCSVFHDKLIQTLSYWGEKSSTQKYAPIIADSEAGSTDTSMHFTENHFWMAVLQP